MDRALQVDDVLLRFRRRLLVRADLFLEPLALLLGRERQRLFFLPQRDATLRQIARLIPQRERALLDLVAAERALRLLELRGGLLDLRLRLRLSPREPLVFEFQRFVLGTFATRERVNLRTHVPLQPLELRLRLLQPALEGDPAFERLV